MGKRLHWIDVARGIGIILVVIGHVPSDDVVKKFIFSFHMPLFFFLSGMLFRTKEITVLAFLKKKINRLIVPYFFFSIITYLLWLLMFRHFTFDHGKDVNPLIPFKGIFIANEDHYHIVFNPAIWFLVVLFFVEVIFFLYTKITKGKFIIVLILLSACIGYISSIRIEESLPGNFFVSFTALVFYASGYLLKRHIREYTNITTAILVILLLAVLIYLQPLNARVDMRANYYDHIAIFYFTSFIGTAIVLLISFKLKDIHILQYFGIHSIIVLLLQFVGIDLMKAFVTYDLNKHVIDTYTFAWTLFYAPATLLFLMPCIKLVNCYPFLLGQWHATKK